MKQLFDDVSFKCSKLVTKPFHLLLSPSIRDAIYSIYGFVRFAEIVDSFHGYDKEV
jgi:phytoene/squalene synthetase